jgi:hypothetical protein
LVSNTLSQISKLYLKDLPESKFLRKKYHKYFLRDSKIDIFGTKIHCFQKKINAKPIDTLKLFYPKQKVIMKETSDICCKCHEGYLIYHPVEFKDKTIHVQATCNECHRYSAYIGKP